MDIETQLKLAQSRSERLKLARDEAERLLEAKSRELYSMNQQLELAQKSLEDEVKQATYELSVSNQRLQKTLDERLRFIGQMSHEVRTPLNAITGLSELLLKTELTSKQYDYADTINSAARSLIVLLNDMLDITKIEAGKLALKPIALDMVRIHRNLVAMFKLEAEQKGLQLELSLGDSLPPFVKLDKGRYRQILNNLVSNAIKYTESGSVHIRVSFEYQDNAQQTGLLKVKVTDTGVGIPKKQIKKIFNAYEQIGNPKSGVGLGLAICSQLCSLMRGEIRCDSKVGVGSTFELCLPTVAVDQESVHRVSDIAVSNEESGHKPRILVAEDNPVNQKVLSAQLAQLGHEAEMVTNGLEALRKLRTQNYDVVFMDIIMPVMDGERTISEIRKSESRIAEHYCVALTASNFQDQEERLLALGFDAFLSKPLNLDRLADTLSTVAMRMQVARSESNDNLTVFDPSYFKQQFGEAWEAVFVDLGATFLEHSESSIAELNAAIDDGQHGSVAKISHSLKGGAVSMGETELADLFAKIEDEPDSLQLSDWQDQVEALWATVSATIRQELQRIASKQQVTV